MRYCNVARSTSIFTITKDYSVPVAYQRVTVHAYFLVEAVLLVDVPSWSFVDTGAGGSSCSLAVSTCFTACARSYFVDTSKEWSKHYLKTPDLIIIQRGRP